MVKKRLIFTLLYNNGTFMLSRNFRLQRVGTLDWLQCNYDFRRIAGAIDELIILDTGRDGVDTASFCACVEQLIKGCFMPLALGGGISSVDQVRQLLRSGADKVVINTALHRNPDLVRELIRTYGSQCVIGSVDYRFVDGKFAVYIDRGRERVDMPMQEYIRSIERLGIGELYLNSIDKDGTGQGYCLAALEVLDGACKMPIIMAGGAGNHLHLHEGISHPQVDAVATANLFNFVGDGLPKARAKLIERAVALAQW